jgi:hypothetical protein
MNRKEIVVFASRALAFYLLVWASMELTYLPEKLMSLHHYRSRLDAGFAMPSADYFICYEQVGIGLLLLRIAILLVLAFALWTCAPWVERFLMPRLQEGNQKSES